MKGTGTKTLSKVDGAKKSQRLQVVSNKKDSHERNKGTEKGKPHKTVNGRKSQEMDGENFDLDDMSDSDQSMM